MGSNAPETPIWGANRRFQAKFTKYSNFHIIKTTAVIPAIQVLFASYPTCAPQIQNGRRLPSWKTLPSKTASRSNQSFFTIHSLNRPTNRQTHRQKDWQMG